MTREAAFWTALEDRRVACRLCPNHCRLDEGEDGPCGSRGNRDGRMVALQYGKVVAVGLDPMEKKPLYHFRPGSPILSVAAQGCNLHCAFCQNWRISQEGGGVCEDVTPEDVIRLAREHDSVGVAYTYSEPLVWYEFVRDTARLARAAGLVNVVVSNGFLEAGPLAGLLPLLDAANIDLKSMDDRFYREVCGARLQPVLDSIAALAASPVHLEITNLVIPGYNDADEQVAALRDTVADLSPEIPLHLSAYRPEWQFDAPATPPETLERAARICHERLHHVYAGNVHLPDWNDTRCPDCDTVVIRRLGYRTECLVRAPECPRCGRALPLVL